MVLENVTQGKKLLGRPRIRWEDRVKEYVGKVRLGIDWMELSLNREIWRQIVGS